jgi:hypothetical protein
MAHPNPRNFHIAASRASRSIWPVLASFGQKTPLGREMTPLRRVVSVRCVLGYCLHRGGNYARNETPVRTRTISTPSALRTRKSRSKTSYRGDWQEVDCQTSMSDLRSCRLGSGRRSSSDLEFAAPASLSVHRSDLPKLRSYNFLQRCGTQFVARRREIGVRYDRRFIEAENVRTPRPRRKTSYSRT